jgi:UDP-glucuronate 4-epimerase
MKIVVTGGAGFLGAHLCRLLRSRGHDVLAFDQSVAKAPTWLKELRQKHGGVPVHVGSILDQVALREALDAFQPQALVNLAAKPGVAEAETKPEEYELVNVKGLEAVLEACARRGIGRIVHASSSSVYGRCTGPMDEQQPLAPLGQYGLTKARGEESIHAAHQKFEINVRILRPFTIIGSLGRPDMAPWKFAENIASGQAIQLHQGARRDFTSVHDVAKAFALAVESGWQGCEAYNIGSGEPHAAEDLARLLAERLGRKLRIEPIALPTYMPVSTWSNSDRAKQVLGWRPEVSFTAAVEEFSQWYQKHANR